MQVGVQGALIEPTRSLQWPAHFQNLLPQAQFTRFTTTEWRACPFDLTETNLLVTVLCFHHWIVSCCTFFPIPPFVSLWCLHSPPHHVNHVCMHVFAICDRTWLYNSGGIGFFSDHNNSSLSSQSLLQNPYYLIFASLAKPKEDMGLHWLKVRSNTLPSLRLVFIASHDRVILGWQGGVVWRALWVRLVITRRTLKTKLISRISSNSQTSACEREEVIDWCEVYSRHWVSYILTFLSFSLLLPVSWSSSVFHCNANHLRAFYV